VWDFGRASVYSTNNFDFKYIDLAGGDPHLKNQHPDCYKTLNSTSLQFVEVATSNSDKIGGQVNYDASENNV
jgi:hypothetical protein